MSNASLKHLRNYQTFRPRYVASSVIKLRVTQFFDKSQITEDAKSETLEDVGNVSMARLAPADRTDDGDSVRLSLRNKI